MAQVDIVGSTRAGWRGYGGEHRQAIEAYKKECSKWGGGLNDGVLQAAGDLISASQVTALESQLCRCLKKPKDEQYEAIAKYLGIYAQVPPQSVLTVLWDAAQGVLKRGASRGKK